LKGNPDSWTRRLEQHEDRIFLVLTLVIGAVVGLVVVAFIVLTGNLGARMYPPGGSPWRRLLVPAAGALVTGYLLSRYFPNARGSGILQTTAALFAREGHIKLRTVLGKFFCCSTSLASVPITSVIMISEATRDYSIIVPLMISNLILHVYGIYQSS
jgi:H+/Cl- antiporter ClcA